jgi:GNAT superfamily N-acetyltransferase
VVRDSSACVKKARRIGQAWPIHGDLSKTPHAPTGFDDELATNLAHETQEGRIMTSVDALQPQDHTRWAELWRGYLAFYETTLPQSRYDETWRRIMQGDGLYGLGARTDGNLVGIAHYLFHPSTWMDDVCYLQDLFVDSSLRGQGAGRKLIEGVAAAAKAKGSPRLYWLTQQTNTTARQLYDRLGACRGFIRYDYTG